MYWIYNYKRGAFYPFVPKARGAGAGEGAGFGGAGAGGGAGGAGEDGGGGAGERDNERELVLKAQIGAELPVEQELDRWFPLWGIPI